MLQHIRSRTARLQLFGTSVRHQVEKTLDALPDSAMVILLGLFLLPYYKPAIIHHVGIPSLFDVFLFAKLGVATIAIVLFLLLGEKRDPFPILALLLCSWCLLLTVINRGNLLMWIDQFYAPFGAICLVLAIYRSYSTQLLYAILGVSFFMLVCNLVTGFLYPGGMWAPHRYFYGNRNSIFLLVLPSLGASLILDACARKSISLRTIIIGLTCAISIAVFRSATSATAFMFLVIGACVVQLPSFRKALNGISCLIGYIVLLFGLVVLRLQDQFSGALSILFEKDTTLSGRTQIWDYILNQEGRKNILFGHGAQDYSYVNIDGTWLDAHNQVLHLWFIGGICALILFLGMLIFAYCALYRQRAHLSAALWVMTVTAFLIVGLTESDPYCQFYLILAMAYVHAEKLSREPLAQHRLSARIPAS